MGRGLGHSVTAYLDTNVVVWLAEANLNRISAAAQRLLESEELLISPMVLLELEYLYEIKRTTLRSHDVQLKIEHELKVRVCELPFSLVADVATGEKWTRDPFDRMIVSQAKANGLAVLISADGKIAEHYPRTVW